MFKNSGTIILYDGASDVSLRTSRSSSLGSRQRNISILKTIVYYNIQTEFQLRFSSRRFHRTQHDEQKQQNLLAESWRARIYRWLGIVLKRFMRLFFFTINVFVYYKCVLIEILNLASNDYLVPKRGNVYRLKLLRRWGSGEQVKRKVFNLLSSN